MGIELYTSLTSLAGVVLGGGLTYFIQRATQRSAERAEVKRLEAARTEARRSERMSIMDRLLVNIQDAERVAAERHYGGVTGAEWQARADAVMDRVWVAEKMVHVLCTPAMVEAAHTFVNLINDVIRRSPYEFDLWESLAAGRSALLAAARRELEATAARGRPAP